MSARYLVRMSEADFAAIPVKFVPRTVRLRDPSLRSQEAATFILSGYVRKLLENNEGLQQVLRHFAGRLDAPECRSQLTQGQRVLYSLAALDGQVLNGGLAQFFWNCPNLIFEAQDALRVLAEQELARAYDQALGSLIGNQHAWLELRRQAGGDPDDFWRHFEASYDVLDLSWFDDAYFDIHGPTLIARLVDYVGINRSEFIES
jgi:hypothetical protein